MGFFSRMMVGAGQGAADVGKQMYKHAGASELEQMRQEANDAREQRLLEWRSGQAELDRAASAEQKGLDRSSSEKIAALRRRAPVKIGTDSSGRTYMVGEDGNVSFVNDPETGEPIEGVKDVTESDKEALKTARSVMAPLSVELGKSFDDNVKANLSALINKQQGVIDKIMAKYSNRPARIGKEFRSVESGASSASGIVGGTDMPQPPGQQSIGDTTRISNQAEYEALPPGTKFIGPDGVPRTKPK